MGNKYIKMAGMLNNGINNFNLRINLDNKQKKQKLAVLSKKILSILDLALNIKLFIFYKSYCFLYINLKNFFFNSL
jgi:hypothetical protein